MATPSFFALAARQRELDRARTAQFPVLFERKQQRMLASPHAFFRGSAPLFYEILAARPDLADGPPGEGFIAGDMHLENVGAFPIDKEQVVFDLNDFDDATVGPIRLDLLRLATSALLAGRAFGIGGKAAITLVEQLAFAHLRGLSGAAAPPLPPKVSDMLRRAETRSRHALLDDRAPRGRDGRRRLLRGERYLDLPAAIEAEVPSLLRAYVTALGPRAPGHASTWEVVDAAQRVAGTGSLGVLRIAVLIADKDGEERIVEMKEEHAASVWALVPEPAGRWSSPGDRVVRATQAMLAEPPRQLAAVTQNGRSFAVRKLFPQEDKLAVEDLGSGDKLGPLAQTIGHLLGKAHARGMVTRPPAAWSSAEVAAIVDHAIELSAIIEGTYLAYARDRREAGER
ncbi:MAG: DUF2252 family protein [Byssovorax sp.]